MSKNINYKRQENKAINQQNKFWLRKNPQIAIKQKPHQSAEQQAVSQG